MDGDRTTLAVASLLGCLLLSTSAAAEGPAIVEGHVFNKLTQVPLENASIQVISEHADFPPGEGPQNNFVVRTDEHGFYAFEVDPDFVLRDLRVTCGSPDGRVVRAQINVPHPGLTLARRDAYLDVARRRTFRTCVDIFFPLASGSTR